MQAALSTIPRRDIELVLSEWFRGLIVSLLTIIDGGTALAERTRIKSVDANGRHLGEGLHELFVGYPMDTGRLELYEHNGRPLVVECLRLKKRAIRSVPSWCAIFATFDRLER
jgi:hypothetical protein